MIKKNYFKYSDAKTELERLLEIGEDAQDIFQEFKKLTQEPDWIALPHGPEVQPFRDLYSEGRIDSWDLYEKTNKINEADSIVGVINYLEGNLTSPDREVFEKAYELYLEKYQDSDTIKDLFEFSYFLVALYNEVFDLIEKLKCSQLYRTEALREIRF